MFIVIETSVVYPMLTKDVVVFEISRGYHFAVSDEVKETYTAEEIAKGVLSVCNVQNIEDEIPLDTLCVKNVDGDWVPDLYLKWEKEIADFDKIVPRPVEDLWDSIGIENCTDSYVIKTYNNKKLKRANKPVI